jgi:hypothetical protein
MKNDWNESSEWFQVPSMLSIYHQRIVLVRHSTFPTILPDRRAIKASIAPWSKLYTFPTTGGVTDSGAFAGLM